MSNCMSIYVEDNTKDWGPKPFKLFNWWLNTKFFVDLVQRNWNSYDIRGWPSFRMKEKLKRLKGDIKHWKKSHVGNPDAKIEQLINDIGELDVIDDALDLDVDEAEKTKDVDGETYRRRATQRSRIMSNGQDEMGETRRYQLKSIP
ncbi:hypothetical protein ACS0TY_024077 [Phlomoides rotata]